MRLNVDILLIYMQTCDKADMQTCRHADVQSGRHADKEEKTVRKKKNDQKETSRMQQRSWVQAGLEHARKGNE